MSEITGWFSEIDVQEFNDEQTEGETNAATSF